MHNRVHVAACTCTCTYMLISFTLVSERKVIMHKLSGGVETLIKTLQVSDTLGEMILCIVLNLVISFSACGYSELFCFGCYSCLYTCGEIGRVSSL